jgi:hypothetical protein
MDAAVAREFPMVLTAWSFTLYVTPLFNPVMTKGDVVLVVKV